MAFGGVALKSAQSVLRIIEFLAAAVCLIVFSYFLAAQAEHHLVHPTWNKAVEGISGSAVLYTIFAILLTCCLGGIAIFGFIAVVLDIAFIGAFVYVAFETRHAANSCSGFVATPLGNGNTHGNSDLTLFVASGKSTSYVPNLGRACRLETAVFACSIILCFLFAITALLQVGLIKHHQKEKRYGPSPNNGYTAGSPRRRFWQRKPKHNNATRDAEIGTVAAGGLAAEKHHHNNNRLSAHQNDVRPSHDTGYTGSTAAAGETEYGGGVANKYAPEAAAPGVAGHTGYGTHNGGYANTTHANPGNF